MHARRVGDQGRSHSVEVIIHDIAGTARREETDATGRMLTNRCHRCLWSLECISAYANAEEKEGADLSP